MILSYKHRFIFFALPKTGSHSVRFAIRPYLGAEDLEQVALFKNSAFPQPDIAAIKHGHLNYRDVLPYFSSELQSFFTFAFVRNPYDRFVSYFFFVKRTADYAPKKNTDEMKKFLNAIHLDKIHMKPQHTFVTDENGKLAVKFIGKLESYATDIQQVFKTIGLPKAEYLQLNASYHLDYRVYYDEELASMIYNIYAPDFDLFGYSPDSYK